MHLRIYGFDSVRLPRAKISKTIVRTEGVAFEYSVPILQVNCRVRIITFFFSPIRTLLLGQDSKSNMRAGTKFLGKKKKNLYL